MLKMLSRVIILGVSIVLLAGCQLFGKGDKHTVNTTLKAAFNINPDLKGRPSPVVVSIYQLAAVDKFNAADFFSLYNEPKQLLANDLLNYQQLEIRPEQELTRSIVFASGTQYVGVIAAYRDLTDPAWRQTIKFTHNKKLIISLAGNQLNLKTA
jgi:type VI secretion system protein VasD